MSKKPITQMSYPELAELIFEKVCREDDCYNATAHGIVYCIGHAYEFPERAEPRLVAAKKRIKELALETHKETCSICD